MSEPNRYTTLIGELTPEQRAKLIYRIDRILAADERARSREPAHRVPDSGSGK